MKSYKNFGKLIQKIRKQNKLTQVQLAEIAGVHSQYVSNAERGVCALPAPAVRIIAREFGVKAAIINALRKDTLADFEVFCDNLLSN